MPIHADFLDRGLVLAGCGNMGGAMLAGWLAAGTDPAAITIVDPAPVRRPAGLPPGLPVHATVPAGCGPAGILILAVKPQKLAEAAPAFAPLVDEGTLVLSVLAAVEFASLRRHFPRARAIVRAVPNLPAAIGAGITGLVADRPDPLVAETAAALCDALGPVEWLATEGLCDAVTALSGSGPAFLFRVIDAMIAAGADLGLEPEQARRFGVETLLGAGRLLAASGESPADLAARVSSPGGTTLAGLAVLDRGGALSDLMARTLAAAHARSRAMAVEFG